MSHGLNADKHSMLNQMSLILKYDFDCKRVYEEFKHDNHLSRGMLSECKKLFQMGGEAYSYLLLKIMSAQ